MLTRKELYNIPGWHTRRHLVVIESDDWGSIRTPSREAYDLMLSQGIPLDRDPYCKYDSLEQSLDFERLFEVLHSVKDKNGNPAILTANMVVANPVFEKIEADGFMQYHYETFIDTYNRTQSDNNTFATWKQGISQHLIQPQFHGREHLNVKKWLSALQQGPSLTLEAFKHRTFGLTSSVDPNIKQYYMGAFNSGLDADIPAYEQILTEGLGIFESIWGFKSESFIATTYQWSPKIEPCLVRNGVKYIQGTVCQKIPLDDDTTVKYSRRCFQGTRSKSGLIRLMRNCYFEPSTKPGYDFVDDCMNRINIAFRWGKAANICAHRVNFIGSIHPENTDVNLPMFKTLLCRIVKQWPDVEFISSDQLGHIIENKIF